MPPHALVAGILQTNTGEVSDMESKVKLFGHPVHPMLIVLPLGLFISAVVFDGAYIWRGSPTWATVAFWNIGAGVICGLLAAVFGAIDWAAIPAGTRAKRIGLTHGLTMVVTVALFATVWLLRRNVDGVTPSTRIFAMEVIALAIGAFGGWLGGELVDRLGVGVDDGANVNAPRSLSRRPAR